VLPPIGEFERVGEELSQTQQVNFNLFSDSVPTLALQSVRTGPMDAYR
jgi:hypothetical protein